jgi:hypothetical protein
MELESDRRYPIGSYRRVPRTFGSVDKVPLVVIASDPPAESAAISYCMSPNELRLPHRYDTSVFAPRNDGSRGFSIGPNVRATHAPPQSVEYFTPQKKEPLDRLNQLTTEGYFDIITTLAQIRQSRKSL